jgi:2-polyprenyl-3-methyl-5-hydroxy-6-metoxy-1,4-benzoquinol methylase
MLTLTRERVPELMDDPSLDHAEHEKALKGLARLNSASGAVWALWRPIRRLANSLGRRDLRVLDVATGSADNPIALWELASRAGYELKIDGCDISEVAVECSRREAEKAGAPCDFFKLDVVADEIPADRYDVVMTSLFTHHLTHEQAVALLRKMAGASRHLVLVDDLVRSYPNLLMVSLATRMLSRSPIVHFDGPASVRNSFTASEFADLAVEAGLVGGRVQEHFPCRMLFEWQR